MVAQLKKVDAPWLWKRWPTILVIIALSLLIFGFPPALPTSTLGVGTRLEISTDKSEYTVGEKINATFYIVNILPLPVRLDPYNTVEFSAYIGGIPQGGTQVGHITWSAGAKITIPPGSRHKMHEASFRARESGNLTIDLNVYVRDDLAGNTKHTVKINLGQGA